VAAQEIVTRSAENPVLEPADLSFPAVAVLNSGAAERDGEGALLDREIPHKMVARSPGFVFQSTVHYVHSCVVPNVVFPTGVLIRGNELWMYYGVADRCIDLATAKIDDLLGVLEG
jgi:hypothetical protein